LDPDWWKGYWYRAQALMKMLRNKPPSTAMAERCEQVPLLPFFSSTAGLVSQLCFSRMLG